MCIIIYKPENKEISIDSLQTCQVRNSHGIGFMAWDYKNDNLIVKKGFFTLEDFLEVYNEYKHLQCVIHFRNATKGDINEENCHPFMLSENLAFVHNGSVDIDCPLVECSDTWHFNDSIKFLEEYWQTDRFEQFLDNIKELLGNSKFVFMDNKGEFFIFNEEAGHWSDGVWYSNNSYKQYKYNGYSNHYDDYDMYNNYYSHYMGENKEIISSVIDNCHICDEEYLNTYKYWHNELSIYCCKDCFIKANNTDDVIVASNYLKCEVCGESGLDIFLNKEVNKWICVDCELVFNSFTTEEKKNFIESESY